MKLLQNRWVLVQRYVTGNATLEELRQMEQWISQDPENEQLVREVKEIWDLTPVEDFEVNVQIAWDQFQARNVRSLQSRIPGVRYISRGSTGSIFYLFRAAGFILVAVIAGFFFHHISSMNSEQVPEWSEFYIMREMTTDRGEKARISFSDGTEVTLNSSSSLRFPQAFHGSAREVHLEGEAYFKVARNPNSPFVVHAQFAEVKVLGTEFNIRGWEEDPAVAVTVLSDKVSVISSEQETVDKSEVILEARYYTRIFKGQGPVLVQKVYPVNHLVWLSGGVHFDNEPFSRVVRDIERRFNVQITLTDPALMDIPYTGIFQYAELDEVLTVIAASMEVGYSRKGSDIFF